MSSGGRVPFRLDDLGYTPLSNLLKQTAIQEMGHAERVAQNADSASKKLFEDLVAAEEGHFEQFDRQAQFVQRFGERYLALQSFQGGGGEEPPA